MYSKCIWNYLCSTFRRRRRRCDCNCELWRTNYRLLWLRMPLANLWNILIAINPIACVIQRVRAQRARAPHKEIYIIMGTCLLYKSNKSTDFESLRKPPGYLPSFLNLDVGESASDDRSAPSLSFRFLLLLLPDLADGLAGTCSIFAISERTQKIRGLE